MTVPYVNKVGTAKKAHFMKLLFRWRGSLWQNIYQHLFIQLTLYSAASLFYWFVLTKYPVFSETRVFYERLCLACGKETKEFPVRMMIGFFVSQLAKRWWWQFQNIGFPDHLCYKLLALTQTDVAVKEAEKKCGRPLSTEEKEDMQKEARLYRRTAARYMNLAIVETLRSVSLKAAKRFPTHGDLVKCGLLTKDERQRIEEIKAKSDKPLHWVPCVWSARLFRELRDKNLIEGNN